MDTDVVHQDELKAFLKRYGEALVIGDLSAIAACYAVPCLFLSDATSAAVSARSEITKLFEGAAEQYSAQGLVAAHPNILRSEAVTTSLVWAEVSWDYRDDQGNSAQPEIYRYVLRLDADTGPQIQVVIAMPDL
jgi:ketosteroid isomerase-like protein